MKTLKETTKESLLSVIKNNKSKIELTTNQLERNSSLLKGSIVIVSDCHLGKGIYSLKDVLFPHFRSSDAGEGAIKRYYDNMTKEQKENDSKFYAMDAIEYYNIRIDQLEALNVNIQRLIDKNL